MLIEHFLSEEEGGRLAVEGCSPLTLLCLELRPLLVLELRADRVSVEVELEGDVLGLFERLLRQRANLLNLIHSLYHALVGVFDLLEPHVGRSRLKGRKQGPMDLTVDFGRQIILQVIVRFLGIFEQSWHLVASLLNDQHSILQQANFFLLLGEEAILVLDHGFELTSIDLHLAELLHVALQAFCNLLLQVHKVSVGGCPRLIQEFLKVLDLATDLVLSFHKCGALAPNASDRSIHLLQSEIDLVFVFHCCFNVLRHSFLLLFTTRKRNNQ